VFAVALAGYCATLCPTVFVEGSGENIVCVWALGVPHPPGFPLYCLLGKAFVGLVPLGEPAFRANLFSAVMGAAAATGLFIFSASAGLGRMPAAAAALTFAFSATFWRQATIAEVYTLSTLLLVVQLGLLLAWRARPTSSAPRPDTTHPGPTLPSANRDAPLLWFGLSLGLGLAVHYQHALLLPAYLLFITLTDRTVWLRGRTLLAASALALLGFALHVYAPIRSAADPPIDWGNPETFAHWWRYLTAEQYRGHMFHQPLSDMAADFIAFLRALPAQLTWPGLPLALGGLLALWRRDRALCWATAAMALVTVVWAVGYDIPWEIDVYYLPAVLVLTIWMGYGLQALLNWARAHNAPRSAAALCLLLPALALGLNFRANDLSDQTFVLDNARDILAVAEPDCAIILPSTNPTFALLYLKHVAREAPELQLFSRLERGIAPTEKAARSASELEVSAEPRFVADALAAGTPVYTVDRQPEATLAGFAQVPWGCIYRIVPADLEVQWRARAPDPLATNFHFDLDRQHFIYGSEQALLACRYLLVRADAAGESGAPGLADGLYERALSLGADLPSVFAKVGQRYAEQGRSERALALYERALERHDDAVLHNRLGVLYGRAGRLDEAENHFRRALELKPDYADAHANLASIYGRRGDIKAAIASLETALQYDPANLLALKNLTFAYAQTDRQEDARRLLERSLDINRAQPEVRGLLASLGGQVEKSP
jgi:tetratricopeptide (TPR) repeat protein